jgi:hypothetical protein
MASLGISEFTFGFAFLYEQTHANWNNLRAVPILPSLIEEGGGNPNEPTGGGYDAHLQLRSGIDYYYQFKMSKYLSRPTAQFYNEEPGQGPYYRFAIPKKKDYYQHRSLRALCGRHPNTYYVAPEFPPQIYQNSPSVGHNYLSEIFLGRRVRDCSRLIPVTLCTKLDDPAQRTGQHHMIYRTEYPAEIKSDPGKPIDGSVPGAHLEKLYRKSGENNGWKDINEKFFTDIFESLIEIIEKLDHPQKKTVVQDDIKRRDILDFNPKEADPKKTLLRISQILMIYFDSTLVLVGEPLPQPQQKQQL